MIVAARAGGVKSIQIVVHEPGIPQRKRCQEPILVMAGENVMPALIDAAEANATVGEMMHTLETVYGRCDGGPEL